MGKKGLLVVIISAVLLVELFIPGLVAALPDDQDLQLEMYHITAYLEEPGVMHVGERVVLKNSSSQEKKVDGLRFTIPEGATSLTYLEGIKQEDVKAEGNQLTYQGAIPSGDFTFGFDYHLTSKAPHFTLDKKFLFDVPVVYVFTPPGQLDVQGQGLQDQGVINMGQEVHLYSMENVTAGQDIQLFFTVGALAGGGGSTNGDIPQSVKFHNPGHIRLWYQSPFAGINAHLFLVLVILIPVVLAGLFIYQRKKNRPSEQLDEKDAEEEMFQRLLVKQKVLMNKLRRLEESFAAQEVDEETYLEQKEAYKKSLINVKLKLKQFAG